MKPDEAIVNNYTSGSNTYSIPVFQRPYEWDSEKWFYLWADIKSLYKYADFNLKQDSSLNTRNALKNRSHFIGTVLTRATDADTYGSNPNQLSQNDYFFIQNGTVNRGSSYVVTTVGTIIFGTTAITFAEFSNSQVYTAGTGLTLTGTTFSITNTAVTAGSYGLAASVPTIQINAQGQITSASNTAIAINGNQITSGTVGSAYISGSYTGITGVGTLTAGTWNATTIGVAYGGTNLTSYTAGDLLYASGTTTLSKLTLGAANYVLTSSGTAPQYVAQSTLSVGSATNATNATNVGITANTANATNYLTFVSATSGNLPELVNSSITCNPSTGSITGGIYGGTF